jgi:CO/xanthine dehydrogenase FAD-binding subunit
MGGGSELLLLHRQGLAGDTDSWVDLRAAGELGSISRASVGLEIGGAVTLSELIQSELVPARTALAQTALEIASRQIRNTATIGGNLCQTKRCWYYRHGFNCYKRAGPLAPCYAIEGDHRQFHAALGGHRCQAVTPSDMATTLTALDGEALVRSSTGNRTVDMEALYVGPGETSLGEGEIIAALRVPTVALERATAFRKMAMYGGGFAMVSAAASVSLDGQGGIADIRVVIGGIAPVPLRAAKVEQSLLNAKPTSETVRAASLLWIADAHPLRNNAWKLTAAAALVARAIGDAVAVYRGEAVR